MAAAATKPPLELSGWLCTTKNFKYGYEKSVLGVSAAQPRTCSLRNRWVTDEVEGVLVPTVLVGTPCGGSNAGSLPLVDLCWGHCWRGGRGCFIRFGAAAMGRMLEL